MKPWAKHVTRAHIIKTDNMILDTANFTLHTLHGREAVGMMDAMARALKLQPLMTIKNIADEIAAMAREARQAMTSPATGNALIASVYSMGIHVDHGAVRGVCIARRQPAGVCTQSMNVEQDLIEDNAMHPGMDDSIIYDARNPVVPDLISTIFKTVSRRLPPAAASLA
jgi:hypothetical protein